MHSIVRCVVSGHNTANLFPKHTVYSYSINDILVLSAALKTRTTTRELTINNYTTLRCPRTSHHLVVAYHNEQPPCSDIKPVFNTLPCYHPCSYAPIDCYCLLLMAYLLLYTYLMISTPTPVSSRPPTPLPWASTGHTGLVVGPA